MLKLNITSLSFLENYLSIDEISKLIDDEIFSPYKIPHWNKKIYIVGSLAKTENIQFFSQEMRTILDSFENFGLPKTSVNDSWTSHGPDPDAYYADYIKYRRMTYSEALNHPVAQSVCMLDKAFIDEADIVIMYGPAGKSAYMELGYAIGSGKKTAIIKNWEGDRVDIMEGLAGHIYDNETHFLKTFISEIIKYLINKEKQ